jgi:hypothetical protein
MLQNIIFKYLGSYELKTIMEEQMYEYVIHAYLWFLLLVPVEEKIKLLWQSYINETKSSLLSFTITLYTINRHVLKKEL